MERTLSMSAVSKGGFRVNGPASKGSDVWGRGDTCGRPYRRGTERADLCPHSAHREDVPASIFDVAPAHAQEHNTQHLVDYQENEQNSNIQVLKNYSPKSRIGGTFTAKPSIAARRSPQ